MKSEPGETGAGDWGGGKERELCSPAPFLFLDPPHSRLVSPASPGYFLPLHHLRAWNRLQYRAKWLRDSREKVDKLVKSRFNKAKIELMQYFPLAP